MHAEAWACLSRLCSQEHAFRLNPRPGSVERAREAARRAVEIDPTCQLGWEALAEASYFARDLGAFRNAAERAMALNRSKHERAGLHGRADQPRRRLGPRRRDHAAFDGAQPTSPGLVSLSPVLRPLPETRVRSGACDDEADEHARRLLDPRRDRCGQRPAGPEGRGPRRARRAPGPPARLPRGARADAGTVGSWTRPSSSR